MNCAVGSSSFRCASVVAALPAPLRSTLKRCALAVTKLKWVGGNSLWGVCERVADGSAARCTPYMRLPPPPHYTRSVLGICGARACWLEPRGVPVYGYLEKIGEYNANLNVYHSKNQCDVSRSGGSSDDSSNKGKCEDVSDRTSYFPWSIRRVVWCIQDMEVAMSALQVLVLQSRSLN